MNDSEKKLKKMIDELMLRVDELEKWKEEKIRQQIKLPLDDASKNVIRNI